MSKVSRRPKRFVTAMDDSGGHAALMSIGGVAVETESQPYVGIGSVTIIESLVPVFEARWNRLRRKIQAILDLDSPPPVHVRWMWGTNRPDKHKNPFLYATNQQVAEWLAEACSIVRDFQKRRNEFGIYFGHSRRENMQSGLEPYYTDPSFEAERRFLASKNVPRGLYKEFHRATVYPLFRVLPVAMWSVYESLIRVGGTSLSVTLDNFTGAEGVEAEDFLRAVRDFAALDRVESLEVVAEYADSALVQAADVVAWAGNRLITKRSAGETDPPFENLFLPMLFEARTLSGTRILGGVELPADVGMRTLCIPYALARAAVHKKHPEFVDEALVEVDDFHRRALQALEEGNRGVSVLTPKAQAWSQKFMDTQK